MTSRVFIGLGSNLPIDGVGSPVDILLQALRRLALLPETRLCGWSSTYESEPLPGSGASQARYANAVCALDSQLAPHELLRQLQRIEADFGRVRSGHRWSSRTLDLDILLYDKEAIATPELTIPHYAMLERNFVLIPLLEISPDHLFIDGERLATWPAASDITGMVLIKRFTSKELALV